MLALARKAYNQGRTVYRSLRYWARSGKNPFRYSNKRPSWNAQVVADRLTALGICVEPYSVDVNAYREFQKRLPETALTRTYGLNYPEKSLEHFISFTLMDLQSHHAYMDVASASSPYPDLFQALAGCDVYRQDLVYPAGVHGKTIGGDACCLPVPDNSFDRLALHCSFEHFEGNGDTDFIREATRILKPGGTLIILPLYLKETHYILTDPSSVRESFIPDEGAEVVVDFTWGNPFGRHYSPEAFLHRVAKGCPLNLRVLHVQNEKEVHPSCYVKFVAVMTKEPLP